MSSASVCTATAVKPGFSFITFVAADVSRRQILSKPFYLVHRGKSARALTRRGYGLIPHSALRIPHLNHS